MKERSRICAVDIVPKTFEVLCACGFINIAETKGEAEDIRDKHLRSGPLHRENLKDSRLIEVRSALYLLHDEALTVALVVSPPGEALGLLQGSMRSFCSHKSKDYLRLYDIAREAK